MNVFHIHCRNIEWRFGFSRTWNSIGFSSWKHLAGCWWTMTCDFFFGSWGCKIFWPLQSSVSFHLWSVICAWWDTKGTHAGARRWNCFFPFKLFLLFLCPCISKSSLSLGIRSDLDLQTGSFLVVWAAQRRLQFLFNFVAGKSLSWRMSHKVYQLLVREESELLFAEHLWNSSCFGR